MYTVTKVKQLSEKSPSKWILSTEEEFEILIEYRYGFLVVMVNDELLHKSKLTTDITDSKISWDDLMDYAKEYFPNEMLNFSLIKTNNNEQKKVQS